MRFLSMVVLDMAASVNGAAMQIVPSWPHKAEDTTSHVALQGLLKTRAGSPNKPSVSPAYWMRARPQPKVSTEEALMHRIARPLAACAALATIMALVACGGGSSTTSTAAPSGDTGSTATAQSVQGVATPSSVSVVTAKNAD
ncbi:MAG TPA: hypothetical protein VFP68_19795 [Burkholderiaceae bacterium]|nr:hypothetical protein [Burkholderiaceae bacterium]